MQGLVPIIKAYAGMQGDFLEALSQTAMDGLVVEALGAGNLPPATLPPLQKILASGLPVVLVSRCFNGIAEPVYDYDGGGQQLQDMGVIFCNSINSQKARLKLLVALNRDLNRKELVHFMES